MLNPTMTLREVYMDLRKHGIRISLNRLSDGIASGLYPFGTLLNTGETGRRTFQIFHTDYSVWRDSILFPKSVLETSVNAPVISPTEGKILQSTHTYTHEDGSVTWEIIIRSWIAPPSDTNA